TNRDGPAPANEPDAASNRDGPASADDPDTVSNRDRPASVDHPDPASADAGSAKAAGLRNDPNSASGEEAEASTGVRSASRPAAQTPIDGQTASTGAIVGPGTPPAGHMSGSGDSEAADPGIAPVTDQCAGPNSAAGDPVAASATGHTSSCGDSSPA